MIIYSQNGRILADVVSMYMSEKVDKNDPSKTIGWNIMGSLAFGKPITIAKYATQEDCKAGMEKLAKNFRAILV